MTKYRYDVAEAAATKPSHDDKAYATASGKVPNFYRFFPSVRFLNCFLIFVGGACNSVNFATFNFTLVCFVNSTFLVRDAVGGNGTMVSNCPSRGSTNLSYDSVAMDYGGDIAWSRASQANVIAAWGWSSVALTLPCGLLIHRFGAKRLIIVAHIACSAASLLMPLAVSLGEWYTFALRLLAGALSGFTWPCIMYIVTRWAPKREAGLLKGFCSCGFSLGIVIAYLVSGYTCSLGPHGWQYAVYFGAALNASIIIPVVYFFSNNPEDSKLISDRELAYILENRHFMEASTNVSIDEKKQPHGSSLSSVPWLKMLTSLPVLATINSSLCLGWAYFFVANFAPAYMKEVLFLDMSRNGLISPLPNIAQFFGRVMFGGLSDVVASKLSPTLSVKIFDGFSLGVPAAMFLVVSFLDCQTTELAVFCLTLGHFFLSGNVAGYFKSMYYIAPKYVSIVTAIGSIAGGAPAIMVSYVVGIIIRNGTLDQWRMTFYVAAAINAWGVLFFAIFGSGKQQAWAMDNHRSTDVELTTNENKEAGDIISDQHNKRINGTSVMQIGNGYSADRKKY